MKNSPSFPRVFSLIEFWSSLPESSVESALASISGATPFTLSRLAPRGTDCWMAEFIPREPDMDLRFTKAVELQIQIARKFDVRAVTYTSESKESKGMPWPVMQ